MVGGSVVPDDMTMKDYTELIWRKIERGETDREFVVGRTPFLRINPTTLLVEQDKPS